MTYRKYEHIVDMDDLQEIFAQAYNAADLKQFFEQFLAGAAAAPALLQIINNSRVLNPPGRMFKKHHVAALLEVFNDENLLQAFYKYQSDLCQSAAAALAWYGDMTLFQLENLIGKKIVKENMIGSVHAKPFILKDGLELILLENRAYWNYNRKADKKKLVIVFLPPQIKQLLRKFLPKPAEYYLTPLKRKSKTEFHYSSEDSAPTEISRIIQFINLGHLTLKKNGQATVKGLRNLAKTAGIREFYNGIDIKALQQLKTLMLANLFSKLNLLEIDTNAKPQDILRAIIKQFVRNDDFIFIKHFFSHIRVVSDYGYIYYEGDAVNIKSNLFKILKEMPMAGWMSVHDIISFIIVRQINILEFDGDLLQYRHDRGKYGNWDDWDDVTMENIVPVLHLPLLQSFFFLAAALGLVEIGYNIPQNPGFRRSSSEFLSEYDGLQIVKLTKLGAYITGKTGKYAAGKGKSACRLHLDTTRPLLTMEGNDPIAALNLKTIMEPAGIGRYMLTYASLLKDCRSKKDVEVKIDFFKNTIAKKPPQIWLDFFKDALERVDPLKADPAFRIFKIEPNQEFLHLLTSDPDISALILKVEGLRIAVELPNLSKLVRLLKKHGYLLTKDSLLI